MVQRLKLKISINPTKTRIFLATQNVNEQSYSNAVRTNCYHQIPPLERDIGNVSHQNFLELRDQIQHKQGMMVGETTEASGQRWNAIAATRRATN